MAKSANAAQKIPLKIRFIAWWNGYDVEDYYRHITRTDNKEASSKSEGAKIPAAKDDNTTSTTQNVADEDINWELPVEPWDEAQSEIARYMWGEGLCGPGGPEYIISISKLLTLNPELSMADVGAGLGGPARALAKEYGLWVSGFEQSHTLAQAGCEMSKKAGMTKKAPIEHWMYSDKFEFERAFDRFLVKEVLYCFEDKRSMINKMSAALKTDGLILFMDYVMSDDMAIVSDAYKEWRAIEPKLPFMITQSEYADLIANSGLILRVNEDRTDEYMKQITEAWIGVEALIKKLMDDPDQRHLVKILASQAELWSRRVQVLKSGNVRMCRFLASKKAKKASMMSDW